MAKLFASVSSENKLLRGLICYNDLTNDQAIKHIERVVSENISPNYFSSDFRGWLYSSITNHFANYSAALTVDLIQRKIIKFYKKTESIDDAKALLEKILNHTFEVQELDPLIDEVKNLYQIRKVSSLTEETIRDLKSIKEGNKEVNSLAIVTKIEKVINEINTQATKERIIEVDAFGDVEADLAQIRDKRDNPEKYRGIDTGIYPLTLATNGWHGGELITVIGRTGQGKSIVLLNFGYSAWLSGANVMYISIEMPYEQQKLRLYSRMTGSDYFKIKSAEFLSNEEMIFIEDSIKKTASEHENVFRIVDAPSNCNAKFIENRIINFEKRTKKHIDLLIIDPIYLMRAMIPEEDNVGAVSWDVKTLARKLNIPIIVANQINREGHKRHLAGKDMDAMDSASSDRLGQNTDIMLGIISDEQQWLKMSIIKYRDGKGPTVFLKRRFDIMKIEYDEEYNSHDEIIAAITGVVKKDEKDD